MRENVSLNVMLSRRKLISERKPSLNHQIYISAVAVAMGFSNLVFAGWGEPAETGRSFKARRDYYLGLPWPNWDIAARGAVRPTAKVTVPYALARLHQSKGKDPAALEYIAGALTDRIPTDEWKAFTRGHRKELETQYDGMFDPLGVVRAIYLYRDSFSQEQLERIAAGARRLDDWTGGGTENHRLMRWSNGFLLAQMFGGDWRPFRDEDKLGMPRA